MKSSAKGAKYCDKYVCLFDCLFVCLSTRISQKLKSELPQFYACCLWNTSDGLAIPYILPVSWMTTRFLQNGLDGVPKRREPNSRKSVNNSQK